jgi:hypothetical protein
MDVTRDVRSWEARLRCDELHKLHIMRLREIAKKYYPSMQAINDTRNSGGLIYLIMNKEIGRDWVMLI